jgi:hypothetical protein
MGKGRHPATAPKEQKHIGDHKNNGTKLSDQEHALSDEASCQKFIRVIQGCIAADSL